MKRISIAVALSILFTIGNQYSSFANLKKQIKVLVKLSATESVTIKGSKSQILKRLRLEAQEREEVTKQIKSLEECKGQDCSNSESLGGDKTDLEISDLEKQEYESTKIIEALSKSIYGPKVQDARNLTPLKKPDFMFFIKEVEYQIYLLEKELTSLRDRSNPALIAFLENFENTNYPKAGYSKEYAMETLDKNLEYQIKGLRKTILGLNNLIKDGNPEGISEMKITPTILLAEAIAKTDENLGENLN